MNQYERELEEGMQRLYEVSQDREMYMGLARALLFKTIRTAVVGFIIGLLVGLIIGVAI